MRSFLNDILSFINTASLSDAEFASIDSGLSYGYNQSTYNVLLAILVARESISDVTTKLYYYFMAQGAMIMQGSTGQSDILIGGAL